MNEKWEDKEGKSFVDSSGSLDKSTRLGGYALRRAESCLFDRLSRRIVSPVLGRDTHCSSGERQGLNCREVEC